MNCQNCGGNLQPGDAACPRCGTAVSVSPSALARPWPRYWARSLDLALWSLLSGVLLGMVAPQWFDSADPAEERFHDQVLGLILLPIAMAGDALTYMLFGNTLGKWAVGLRVRDVGGEKLKPLRYLARNARVYVNGLALGLGLIAIFTLIHQYRRARSGELVSWDEKLESRVQHVRGGMLRTSVTATIVVVVCAGTFALSQYLTHLSPEDNLRWMADIANKGAPRMVGEHTRLDRVSVAPGLLLQYDFTRLDADSAETPFDAEGLRKEAAKAVCGDLSFALEQNGRVRYRYADREGKALGAIEISKADCAQKP